MTIFQNSNLLACPFCGNSKPEIVKDNDGFWWATCPKCQACSKGILPSKIDPVPELIERWNSRAGGRQPISVKMTDAKAIGSSECVRRIGLEDGIEAAMKNLPALYEVEISLTRDDIEVCLYGPQGIKLLYEVDGKTISDRIFCAVSAAKEYAYADEDDDQ